MRSPGSRGPAKASAGSGDAQALQLLGLARRARYVAAGTHAVQEAARRGELAGVLVARDAGENARDRVLPLLAARGIPFAECAPREKLGRALGRGPVVVVGVKNRELAARMLAALGVRPPRPADHTEEDRR